MKKETTTILTKIEIPEGSYCAKFRKINGHEECEFECDFLMGHYCMIFKRQIEEKGKYYSKCDKCIDVKEKE